MKIFHERLEELELSWADDFHISNSMIQKTIGFMKQNQPSHTLIKMLKDEEDRHFAKNYYYKAFLTGKILRKNRRKTRKLGFRKNFFNG